MLRAILLFPRIPHEHPVHNLRRKFDPLVSAIAPHITLVFPFDSDCSNDVLCEHIVNCIGGFRTFSLDFRDISGMGDEYLYLNIERGNDEAIALHRALYTGILEGYRDRRYTFVPHVTVGRLPTEELFRQALSEAVTADCSLTAVIDEVILEEIGQALESTVIARFELRRH